MAIEVIRADLIELRPKPCLVRADFKAKTIDIVDEKQEFRSWNDPYYIGFDRIRTAEALVAWIVHLQEKTWFTDQHTRQMIFVWQQVTGKAVLFDA
jgi:hypothetical protein